MPRYVGGKPLVKIRIAASGAACVLLANPAFADDLTISSKTTSPVSTANAANNTPGNIIITTGGSVEVTKTGPAVLLNSSNTVSNSGTISNSVGSSAVDFGWTTLVQDLIHAEAWSCGCGREEKQTHIEPFSR